MRRSTAARQLREERRVGREGEGWGSRGIEPRDGHGIVAGDGRRVRIDELGREPDAAGRPHASTIRSSRARRTGDGAVEGSDISLHWTLTGAATRIEDTGELSVSRGTPRRPRGSRGR